MSVQANKPVCKLTEKTWDLIVVGGGFSGIAAAVTARRQGLQNVLILEKAGFLIKQRRFRENGGNSSNKYILGANA